MWPDFQSYTELTQLVTTFAMGLAFGSSSLSLGWLIVFVIVYEIGLFITLGSNVKYWRGFMRLSLNCVYLLGLLLGDWLMHDEKMFDAFIHDIPSKHDESEIVEWLDPILNQVDSWTR